MESMPRCGFVKRREYSSSRDEISKMTALVTLFRYECCGGATRRAQPNQTTTANECFNRLSALLTLYCLNGQSEASMQLWLTTRPPNSPYRSKLSHRELLSVARILSLNFWGSHFDENLARRRVAQVHQWQA